MNIEKIATAVLDYRLCSRYKRFLPIHCWGVLIIDEYHCMGEGSKCLLHAQLKMGVF